LRRQVTGTFLTVQANRERPAIIAFRFMKNAKMVKSIYCQMEKPKQEVIIYTYTEHAMASMLKNSHLDIDIIDESITITFDADPHACSRMMERALLPGLP